jgi:chromatin segregation and condensation protein Rec8/ScpA/Scc1 (kleisin family)
LELSTRCSSMSSQSSWSAESAILSTSVGDSELMRHQKTRMGPVSPCRELKETARTVNELVEDDEFIDLGLDDWPVCEASDGSLECLSPRAIKIVNDGKGNKIASSRDENLDDTVQEKMADIVGNLSYSLCCEEFVDGQSSTTMLVYFCAVLGISNDGSIHRSQESNAIARGSAGLCGVA